MKIYDLIIIGAGPAGLSAALYAKRSNLNVLVFEKEAPGGKVLTTATVENYPGFSTITGPDLAYNFYDQCVKLGVDFKYTEVINVNEIENDYKEIITSSNDIFTCKSVIISTGMVNRKLNIPNEDKFFHKGISYCAICDGNLFKNKKVAVIGSGRSAVEESIFLSEICSNVVLISNKKELKADQIIIDKLSEIKNINVLMNTDTISFNGKDFLESITVKEKDSNKEYNIELEGSFIFIGFNPVAPLVNNETIIDNETKFIKQNEKMETKYPGIFSAGDINTKSYRQISTAISDGTIAALNALEYISFKKWK